MTIYHKFNVRSLLLFVYLFVNRWSYNLHRIKREGEQRTTEQLLHSKHFLEVRYLPRDKTCNQHEHWLGGEMLTGGTLEGCVHAETTNLAELSNRIAIRIHWKEDEFVV